MKAMIAAIVTALSIGALAPAASAVELGSQVRRTWGETGDAAFRAGDTAGDAMIAAAQLARSLNPR